MYKIIKFCNMIEIEILEQCYIYASLSVKGSNVQN